MLAPRAELSEREMFGGIAFMLAGNMAVGVIGDDLMVRLGDDAERGAGASRTCGRWTSPASPMKTTVYVDAGGTAEDDDLAGGSTRAPTSPLRCPRK